MATIKASDITLNIAPVQFSGDTLISIGVQPYESSDQLKSLRAAHRETYFFRRYENVIASVSLASEHQPIGEQVVERKLGDVSWLVAPLALEALLRYFHGLGRPILSHKPLQVLSNRQGDQLLSESASKEVEIPDWLEKKASYVFDTRILYPDDRTPRIVLACDVRACHLITMPCDELIRAGVPLESRYVQIHQPDGDPRLLPKTSLAGKVLSAEDGILTLTDHREGYATVPASEAYLEPRRENISWCLQHLFPDMAQTILNGVDAASARLRNGKEKLRRIQSIFEYLRTEPHQLLPGVDFTLGPILKRVSGREWFPRHEVIQKPILVFDPAGSRTDIWNERGIDSHGPYDQRSFTPKRPRIVVICQAGAQGQVEQFLHKFLEGLPSVVTGFGERSRAPYAKGFIRRYALEQAHLEVFPAKDARSESYLMECRRAIESAAANKQEWDLAIVQIEDAFHQLWGDENPYLATKSLFMKHQIPVQEVTLEKICAPNSELVYILNNISLATYAKLNGTPWLLKSDSTIAHELVIGIGIYHLSEQRLGPKERVVGITTVFTGDGNYVLDNKTAAVPYDDYAAALLSSLRESIQAIRKDQNWKSSDSIRLIFHTFKPFKDTEVTVVDKVMAELGHPNVKHAFVHFVDDHPFHVFDECNQGAYFSRDVKKGVFAPQRGLLLKLNRSEALLSFKGANELKQPEDGIPFPTLLRLHRNSSFTDLTYIARQAFNFSCHSWRTFSPAPLPITILYSELIAKLLRELDDVTGWDADAMLGRIGRTRWFL